MLKRRKILLISVGVFILLTFIPVVAFRFIQVDTTSYMLIRQKQYHDEGKPTDYQHQYIPLSQMPQKLIEAVITAEDNTFLQHNGFNYGGIMTALKHNIAGKRPIRGGSSITQQMVKNVFLWPDRTWTRKAVEAYFTILVNAIWSKEYQMEVYLNSIEMGENIYGIEAAAQHHFNVSASELTEEQCVKIVSILPNPCNWSPIDSPDSIIGVQKQIMKRMECNRQAEALKKLNWGHPNKIKLSNNN